MPGAMLLLAEACVGGPAVGGSSAARGGMLQALGTCMLLQNSRSMAPSARSFCVAYKLATWAPERVMGNDVDPA